MVKKLIIAFTIGFILSIFYLAATLSSSFAQEIQCPLNRQPDVYYPIGLHQIYGEKVKREGEDSVYHLDGGNALQCFCSPNGEGIQTTWTITTDDLPGAVNGDDWGLENVSYVAVNTPYICNITPTITTIPTETIQPTETATPSATLAPTEVPQYHEEINENAVVLVWPGEQVEQRGVAK